MAEEARKGGVRAAVRQLLQERAREGVALPASAAPCGTRPHASRRSETVAAWGSRYPNHDTGTVEEVLATLAKHEVPESTVVKYLAGNALRHFGLD